MKAPFIPKYSLLVDVTTNVVLTFSTQAGVIALLSEILPDAGHFPYVNYPNYMYARFGKNPFFLADLKAEKYPEWTWDRTTRVFSKTRSDVLTFELRKKAALAESKCDALRKVIYNISAARTKPTFDVAHQDIVYFLKRTEARAFRDSGYDDARSKEFPFVVQYADLADISLKQAANDILLKAELGEDILLKTELMRLKYFKLLKEAETPERVAIVMEEFNRGMYTNARL